MFTLVPIHESRVGAPSLNLALERLYTFVTMFYQAINTSFAGRAALIWSLYIAIATGII